MGVEYLPAYLQEKLATVLWQAPKTWPLNSKEHVVLVQQTDGDPEIHPEEPLEPANWKWGGFHSVNVGWFSIELQCLCRRNNQYHSKPPSQRTVTCTHSQPSLVTRCMILYNPLTSREAKWSDVFPVTHGLVQPSIQRPLLGLIYVNDMPFIIKHSELSMLMTQYFIIPPQIQLTWRAS